MDQPVDKNEARRKRLLWRAQHRGIREMDLLLGGFAAAGLAGFTEPELRDLEAVLELPDQDLLAWVTGQAAVPEALRSAMLDRLLAFRP